jgi:hypothetical protein
LLGGGHGRSEATGLATGRVRHVGA